MKGISELTMERNHTNVVNVIRSSQWRKNLPNISEDILGKYHINAVYVRGTSQVKVICTDTSGHTLERNCTNEIRVTKPSHTKVLLTNTSIHTLGKKINRVMEILYPPQIWYKCNFFSYGHSIYIRLQNALLGYFFKKYSFQLPYFNIYFSFI